MTTPQIVGALLAAMLLFWTVGAYNRLVRLRATIVRRFAPVQEQLRQRHALLVELVDALQTSLPASALPRIESLRAACRQVEASCTHAQRRPGASGAIASLRMAEDILGDARAQLPAPGAELAELGARLAASDATLSFARRQFNLAVDEYNAAVQQFPTLLLVGVFGFRSAGTL